MTDFDLGDPAPDADDEPDSSEDTTADPEPDTEPTDSEADHTESAGSDQSETDTTDDETESVRDLDPTEIGPAFPYSDVRQNPLYARDETWTEFEDKLDMQLTPDLREEEIRDDELREIHDIVLEVAIDHLDEFPERLKEKRRELR